MEFWIGNIETIFLLNVAYSDIYFIYILDLLKVYTLNEAIFSCLYLQLAVLIYTIQKCALTDVVYISMLRLWMWVGSNSFILVLCFSILNSGVN